MYWYKEETPDPFIKTYKKSNSLTTRIQKTFSIYLILLFILSVGYVIVSGFNYVDIPNTCMIKIKYDVVEGNKRNIVEAIKKIKETDFILYKDVCRYANTIYEKKCMYADETTNKTYLAPFEGCFIKGSRAIMINPIPTYSEKNVEIQTVQIKKLTEIATYYWHSLK